MHAPEFLIDRLEEQIKLAPQLIQNDVPGGSVAEMVEKLREGSNLAHHVPSLRAVEAGARRYAKCLTAATTHVQKLGPLFDSVAAVHSATYRDELQKKQAMDRFKDTPKQIIDACKAAIAELNGALKVLDEGDAKEARLAGAGAR